MGLGVEMNELEKREDMLSQRRDVVRSFLGSTVTDLRAGGGAIYDLEAEFQKTKNNRSAVVPIVISVVIVIVTMGSWWLTAVIDREARKVSVDISAFEDLNLKDLLDVAKRSVEELDAVLRDISLLEGELSTGLSGVERELLAAKQLNAAAGLDAAALAARNAEADRVAASGVQALRERLEPQIAEKYALKEELERRIAAYDQRSLAQAKQQQETMDNQQRLFDLEKQELTAFYEKRITALEKAVKDEKAAGDERVRRTSDTLTTRYTREMAAAVALYNPSWTDAAAEGVAMAAERLTPAAVLRDSASLPSELPIRTSEYAAASNSYDDFRAALERLQSVPYKNSIPSYLKAAESAGNALAASYDNLATRAAAVIRERESVIAARDAQVASLKAELAFEQAERVRVEFGLAALSRREGDAGYVLDQRDQNRLLLYIDPIYTITGRTRAWAFREADEPVAELIVWKEASGIVGSVTSIEDGITLQPFDRILLGPSEVTR